MQVMRELQIEPSIFFSLGLMDDSATEEQYNALYDLTLLEEPGMELNKDGIIALINSLK